MKDEMWSDMVDMFDGDDVEAEADEVCNQVLEELGIEVGNSMVSAPTSKIATSNTIGFADEDEASH